MLHCFIEENVEIYFHGSALSELAISKAEASGCIFWRLFRNYRRFGDYLSADGHTPFEYPFGKPVQAKHLNESK